jgi:hypothetical protein
LEATDVVLGFFFPRFVVRSRALDAAKQENVTIVLMFPDEPGRVVEHGLRLLHQLHEVSQAQFACGGGPGYEHKQARQVQAPRKLHLIS